MGWQAWLSVLVVGGVIWALAAARWAPEVVLTGGLVVLLWTGVLTPSEALAGFANEGMITIAVLFIVSAGLVETGAVYWVAERLFGRPRSVGHAMWRVMGPSALLSAFMNNTPLVAMLLPAVQEWARRYQISLSKLLIPLSYAAILGGTCTLIGTSTNLVVNGMVIQAAETSLDQEGQSALPRGLRLLDITWVGVPAALAGIGFMLLVGRWLLPDRIATQILQEDPRQYAVEMMVEPGSPLVGKTIEQAGLRHLPGVFLAEIERQGMLLPAVGPQERLRGGDRLVFVGIADSVVDLQKIRGLTPAPDQIFKLDTPRPERCLLEAVVSTSCPVVGKTIRDGRFRSVYGAVVIAVSRHGQRIPGKVGDIVLQAGDTLLLEAHPSFLDRHRNHRDFFLISRLENSSPPRFERAGLALAILLGMVLLVAGSEWLAGTRLRFSGWETTLGRLSMLKAGLIAAGLMLATGCCRLAEMRRAMDGRVLLAIAGALGLGLALEKTGAARFLVGQMLLLVGDNPWLALALIHLLTSLLTEVVTNNAAAALMTPFALATACQLHVQPMPFIISVMMAASSSFATPIGYQTNLMVYGPGGYRFSDFLKVGIPMNLLVMAVTVVLAPRIWPFYG